MKMKLTKHLNQKGLTLIELLAVVVIMGILALVATVSISTLLERAKQDAFVANAIALKNAGTFYVKNHVGIEAPIKLTYKELLEDAMIEPIQDPFTNADMPSSEESYVLLEKEKVTKVCFIGATKNLCTIDGNKEPLPVEELSISAIKDNDSE